MKSEERYQYRWLVTGRVQGVGFRPFIFRLAQCHQICGWVQNQQGQVAILGEATASALLAFEQAISIEAPPLAQPHVQRLSSVLCSENHYSDFQIQSSSTTHDAAEIHLPPDYFACDECLQEMWDQNNRRYQYPFINCTQCGPRYTLITRLPYDRPYTTMADFPLCPECEREYRDPADRRFHAQPIACPVCGPQLSWHSCQASSVDPLQACLHALRAGEIVAVKGIGGYHLICDARNDAAVARLRQRKPRPHKPLAVMFPRVGAEGLEKLCEHVQVSEQALQLLNSPIRPIVLLTLRPGSDLSKLLAPGLQEIGAMLPYSPLHELLLHQFAAPLVATSANISGEPVLTNNQQAVKRLQHITPHFLHHNRPIQRPADDPVYRFIAGQARPLRLGRGCAPLELELQQRVPYPLLAVGAQMKNMIALAWDKRVVISPHIGELGSVRSYQVFQQVIADLQQIYQVQVEAVVCDAHPDYTASRWAANSGLALNKVWHHHAHASALYGEHQGQGNWLVFTWDGTGLGVDGQIWGGEALYGQPGNWQRVASLSPLRLPGGDQAGREPWRSAVAACWEADQALPVTFKATSELSLLKTAWQRGINSPVSSAAGRWFDVAAVCCGLLEQASFEGQGPNAIGSLV